MGCRVSRSSRACAFGLLALLATPLLALAQEAPVEQYRLTTTYNVGVRIAPLVPLVAAGGTAEPGAEVVVPLPGGVAPSLPPATDAQGRAANHHLDVILFVVSNGRPVTDVVPTISLVLQAGQQRFDASLVPLQGGPNGHHFGTNLYLPDGTYTASVEVGAERAVFPSMVLGAPSRAPLPGVATPAARVTAQPTPGTLPNNGAAEPSGWSVALGAALLAAGLAWRARRILPRRG